MTSATTLEDAFAEICLMDGPLNRRLAAYGEKLRELNFPFAEAYDSLVARLMAGEIGSGAPKPGELMPPFILPAHSGALISLEDLLATGPLVMSFNRGHWCPFCRIELHTIASFHAEIAARGGQVVSIIPDRQKFAGRLEADALRTMPILTDIDNGYALSLGLVLWLGERLKGLMKGRGLHLEEYHGNDGWFVPLPATFVVSRDGRIVARNVDPDFRKRMEIDEIVAALEAAA